MSRRSCPPVPYDDAGAVQGRRGKIVAVYIVDGQVVVTLGLIVDDGAIWVSISSVQNTKCQAGSISTSKVVNSDALILNPNNECLWTVFEELSARHGGGGLIAIHRIAQDRPI